MTLSPERPFWKFSRSVIETAASVLGKFTWTMGNPNIFWESAWFSRKTIYRLKYNLMRLLSVAYPESEVGFSETWTGSSKAASNTSEVSGYSTNINNKSRQIPPPDVSVWRRLSTWVGNLKLYPHVNIPRSETVSYLNCRKSSRGLAMEFVSKVSAVTAFSSTVVWTHHIIFCNQESLLFSFS